MFNILLKMYLFSLEKQKQNIEYIAVACLVHKSTMYTWYTHVFTVFTKFILFDYDRVQKLWMVIYLYQLKKWIRYLQGYIQYACMYLQFKWVCDVSRPVLINKIQTNLFRQVHVYEAHNQIRWCRNVKAYPKCTHSEKCIIQFQPALLCRRGELQLEEEMLMTLKILVRIQVVQ